MKTRSSEPGFAGTEKPRVHVLPHGSQRAVTGVHAQRNSPLRHVGAEAPLTATGVRGAETSPPVCLASLRPQGAC